MFSSSDEEHDFEEHHSSPEEEVEAAPERHVEASPKVDMQK